MYTQEQLYARKREIALRVGARIDDEEVHREAVKQLNHEYAPVAQAAAAQAEAAAPPRDVLADTGYEASEARHLAFARWQDDPLQQQMRAARRAQLEQERDTISADLRRYSAPRLQRLREIADELAKL